jgi:hypothetical protein
LIRSSDAARDGKVLVWGEGLPAPRPITGLDDVCWIAGPYAVTCNGQLLHAEVTGIAGGQATFAVTPVAGVSPIWRVSADFPVERDTVGDPNIDPEDIQVTHLALSHTAIAQDGTIYRLSGATATVE